MRGNNKGFTLVELLAVLILVSVIMAIAIPSIGASMSRAKGKENASNKRVLESAAEIYISDYKHNVKWSSDVQKECYVTISELLSSEFISEDDAMDSDGNEFSGVIVYNREKNTFKYEDEVGSISSCL